MLEQLRIVLANLREQRRAESLSREQFEALKLEKFRRLAAHAADRSPYYARIVRERGIVPARCVPGDFPVLTKPELMAHFDEIVTAPGVTKRGIAEFLTTSHDPGERFLDRYRVIHTSGSSGEVGYFVYSPSDWARGVWPAPRRLRASPPRRKRGFRKPRFAYYGATDGHYAGVTMVSAFNRGIFKLLVDSALYEINDPLSTILDALNAFQPDYLIGYTTGLKILAEKQLAGLLSISPGLLGTAGEATTTADAALLERAFGCTVTNTYACSEHLGMGTSVPGGREMVLHDHELIYEFHEDHTLVTNLFNYTLPLIRYRMADVLRPIRGKHAYEPYLLVESLIGRNEMLPTFRNRDGAEDFVSPHTINEIFVEGLTRFQMHLVDSTRFRFLVCLDPQLDAAQRDECVAAVGRRLREILDHKRMDTVDFEVVVADDLPVDPKTRKFRLIVRDA